MLLCHHSTDVSWHGGLSSNDCSKAADSSCYIKELSTVHKAMTDSGLVPCCIVLPHCWCSLHSNSAPSFSGTDIWIENKIKEWQKFFEVIFDRSLTKTMSHWNQNPLWWESSFWCVYETVTEYVLLFKFKIQLMLYIKSAKQISSQ